MCICMLTLLFILIHFIQLVVIKIYAHGFTAIHLFILSFTFIFVSRINFLVSEVKKNKKTWNLSLLFVLLILCLRWNWSVFIWNYLCFVFIFESHYHLVCNSSLAIVVVVFFPSTLNILYNYLLLLFVFVVGKPAVLLLLPGWSYIFPLHFVFRNFTMMYLIRISLHLFY